MSKTKVVIIDDEQLAIDVIVHHLSFFLNYKILKTFLNPKEAISFLRSNEVDLIFTDIAMPEVSGVELVGLLKGKGKFIMTTSYSEYAIESFSLNVVDYLLKPISVERFKSAIDHYENIPKETVTQDDSFFVKEGEEFVKVNVQEIDYIEGKKDYAKIVCGNRHYMILKTLKSLESFLEPYSFLRVHKSYIIPKNKILQFNGHILNVNQHQIPVGGSYRSKVITFLEKRRL